MLGKKRKKEKKKDMRYKCQGIHLDIINQLSWRVYVEVVCARGPEGYLLFPTIDSIWLQYKHTSAVLSCYQHFGS